MRTVLHALLPTDGLGSGIPDSIEPLPKLSKEVATLWWESELYSDKVKPWSLTIVTLPAAKSAEPYPTHQNIFRIKGKLHITTSRFLHVVGQARDGYTACLYASPDRIQYHNAYDAQKLFDYPLFNPVSLEIYLRTLSEQAESVRAKYPSNEWNYVYDNIFRRLAAIETILAGSSPLTYSGFDYYQMDRILGAIDGSISAIRRHGPKLKPKTQSWYNDLYHEIVSNDPRGPLIVFG